jgi:anti-sigma factor RsiW
MGCDNSEKLLLLTCGELEEAQTAALRGHLASCGACTAELEELRGGLAALSRLPELQPGAGVERQVYGATAGRLHRYRLIRPNFVHRYRSALAVAAALTVVFGWGIVADVLRPTPDAAALRQMWTATTANVIDSNAMAADLADLNAGDAWAQAGRQIVSGLKQTDLTGELLDLRDGVSQLEDEVGG